ncbi:hypothetical protein P692DRAFT_201424168 [Suillus brevipes Sb2]|nr:hypothetical protein P692DRAFT_201424168 [Suillus brevipes Sb2]
MSICTSNSPILEAQQDTAMISSLIIQIIAQLRLRVHPSIGAVCLVPFASVLGPQMRLDHHLGNPAAGISAYVL